MRGIVLLGTVVLLTGSVIAAQSGPKDDIKSAAKKLGDKSNYSWKSTVESAGGGQFRRGPTEGKTEKDGFTTLSMSFGDNTLEAVLLKEDKGALKTPDGWRSLAEAAEDTGQQNPGRFIALMLRNYRTPASEAENLAAKTKELTKSDDSYSGELTEEGAKELLTFRRGGNAPAPTGAKGTVKFWVKDGVLTKYEFRVQGTVTFNNNDVNVDRTTTVEIKDVGSTKVEVSEEAKKKAS